MRSASLWRFGSNRLASGLAKEMLNFVLDPDAQARASDLAGYLPLSDGARVSQDMEAILGLPYEKLKKQLIEPDWTFIAERQSERADLLGQILNK